uniref:Poly(A) polymerase RNA-binding domain-containing protein n=1 Tax=Aegilops tauschii subsp. strangulata TaxID=200361 RepID=A0A453C486_AEGTS
ANHDSGVRGGAQGLPGDRRGRRVGRAVQTVQFLQGVQELPAGGREGGRRGGGSPGVEGVGGVAAEAAGGQGRDGHGRHAALCHPHPHAYAAKPHDDDRRRVSSFFVGLSKPAPSPQQPQQPPQFDLRLTTQEFKDEVYTYAFWRPGMELDVSHTRRKDLQPYVLEQILPADRLKRKRSDDGSGNSESSPSPSSRASKRAAAAGRIGSSPESET